MSRAAISAIEARAAAHTASHHQASFRLRPALILITCSSVRTERAAWRAVSGVSVQLLKRTAAVAVHGITARTVHATSGHPLTSEPALSALAPARSAVQSMPAGASAHPAAANRRCTLAMHSCVHCHSRRKHYVLLHCQVLRQQQLMLAHACAADGGGS